MIAGQKFNVFSNEDSGNLVLISAIDALGYVAVQTALQLISECKKGKAKNTLPKNLTGLHGSMMASLAEFLYALVQADVAGRSGVFHDHSMKVLVAKALADFQRIKKKERAAIEKERGKGWGSATRLYDANYADLNQKFLAT